MINALGRRMEFWLPPVIAGLAILALWQVTMSNVESFLLPAPFAIIGSLADNWDVIWAATKNTGFIILSGLAMGVVAGAVLALTVTRFRTANDTLTPLAVAINAIPIIALAPIFNAWYGILSTRSNQAVVMVVVFFPVFINTARGLTEVEPSQIELMRSYAASDWRITREVRIPNALPFFFTALKVVASLSVIAAIVAEYFGGRTDALGPLIVQRASLGRYDEAWAAVFAGAAIGILLYFAAVTLERLAMPWNTTVVEDTVS